MAEQPYEFGLTYAGVPFTLDEGHSGPRHLPADQLRAASGRVHSPDLWTEINRLIDLRHVQDVVAPSPYPGRNLGALPFKPYAGPDLVADRYRLGDFYYPVGANRYAIFRGLMVSSMVKDIVASTFGGTIPAPFVMKMVPQGLPDILPAQYQITTSMYMLPPRPVAEHGGGQDGLYVVTLVDDRYYWPGTPATLHPTGSTTWADFIAQLATALGVTITHSTIDPVYGQPEADSQLWTNAENAAVLLDAVAYNLGRTVVRNLDGTYALLTPLESRAIVQSNRGSLARLVRHAGGDLFASGGSLPVGNLTPARNAVVPSQVNVTFPKYVNGDDPVPHFLNPRYASGRPSCWYEDSYGDTHTVTVPITSGGPLVSGLSGVGTHTISDTGKAYYPTEAAAVSGGVPDNASGLTALAMQLAQDHYESQVAFALDEVYPGIYAWDPEGLHDLLWTYSSRACGAFTRVMRSVWNNPPTEFQHAVPDASGSYTARGVGGPSVAQTWQDRSGVTTSGSVYGVNLVTVGSGLRLYPGVQTSGGISEVILVAEGGGSSSGGSDCVCCTSGFASGDLLCVSGYPTGPVVSGPYIAVSGLPGPGLSGYVAISGSPNPGLSGYVAISGSPNPGLSGYVAISGYDGPVISGNYISVSGVPNPVQSGPYTAVSGLPNPGLSGYVAISGSPTPSLSGYITVSGYPHPVVSGVWQMLSGSPTPKLSGTAVAGGLAGDVFTGLTADAYAVIVNRTNAKGMVGQASVYNTSGTASLQYTFSATDQVGNIFSGPNLTLTAGQAVQLQYVDTFTNPTHKSLIANIVVAVRSAAAGTPTGYRVAEVTAD